MSLGPVDNLEAGFSRRQIYAACQRLRSIWLQEALPCLVVSRCKLKQECVQKFQEPTLSVECKNQIAVNFTEYSQNNQHSDSRKYKYKKDLRLSFSQKDHERQSNDESLQKQTESPISSRKVQSQVQNKVNPFALNSISQRQLKNIKVLVIFYSGSTVSQASILKATTDNKQIQLPSTYYFFRVNEWYLAFVGFQIDPKQKQNTRLQIKLKTGLFTGGKIDKYILFIKQYQNICILQVHSIKYQNPNSSKIKNISLYESIYFIIKKFLKNPKDKDPQIYVWLKLLQQLYLLDELKGEDYKQHFCKFYFSKSQAIAHSKYFIYFFYAVNPQKTYQLFMSFRLLEKMSFLNYYQRAQQFLISEKINNGLKFYERLQLQYMLKQCRNNALEIQNIVKSCLKYQSKHQIFQILIIVVNNQPQIISKMDQEILQEIKDNQNLNAIHYFFVKIKYFACLIKNKSKDQVSCIILKFVDDLIDICKFKPVVTDDRFLIQQKSIKYLFIDNIGFWNPNILRLNDQYLCDAYQKCKQLSNVSENRLNFIDAILNSIGPKFDAMLRKDLVKMTMCMIKAPINQTNIEQLQYFFSNQKIYQVHIKQLIQDVIIELNQQTVQQFETLIQLNLNSNSRAPQLQFGLILEYLDYQNTLLHEDVAKTQFLTRMFSIFLYKIKCVSCFYKSCFKIEIRQFKIYTQTIFKLKSHHFKHSMANTILNEIKSKFGNQKQQVINNIVEIYPYQYKQYDKQRQFWIMNYTGCIELQKK